MFKEKSVLNIRQLESNAMKHLVYTVFEMIFAVDWSGEQSGKCEEGIKENKELGLSVRFLRDIFWSKWPP
jgi:hypothetical protein